MREESVVPDENDLEDDDDDAATEDEKEEKNDIEEGLLIAVFARNNSLKTIVKSLVMLVKLCGDIRDHFVKLSAFQKKVFRE